MHRGSDLLKKKRRLIKAICIIMSVLLTVVWYYNNFTIQTVETDLLSQKVEEEIRIVLVSDIHLSFYTDCDKITQMIKESTPDIIFLLGDMYSRNNTQKIDQVIEFTKNLSEIAMVYAVTGDHDYDKEYKQKLNNLGAKSVYIHCTF